MLYDAFVTLSNFSFLANTCETWEVPNIKVATPQLFIFEVIIKHYVVSAPLEIQRLFKKDINHAN